HSSGYDDEALTELNRVVELAPEHLRARFDRALLLRKMRRDGQGHDDFAYIMQHPRFEEFLQEADTADCVYQFHALNLLQLKRVDQALRVATEGLARAQRTGKFCAESHYVLACAYAVASRNEPDYLSNAMTHLDQAVDRYPAFEQLFRRDSRFNGMRAKIHLGD